MKPMESFSFFSLFTHGLLVFSTLLITGTTGQSSSELAALLRPLLSGDAQILLPGSEGFENGTDTMSAKKPQLDILVRVATEEDVQRTIQFANKYERPFLAISGGHGETWKKGLVKNGIGISMRGLSYVNISKDGASATIGGGTETGEVISALWSQGKLAVTTACDCVGIIAPMLGGGHGWLQGQYGLLTDNILSARLVLADGSLIQVSDEKEDECNDDDNDNNMDDIDRNNHHDLFWALRGAGHNFGIVTSVEYRIWDIPTDPPEAKNWAYVQYTLTQDKLEALFTVANGLLRSETQRQPVALTHYGHFQFNPEIDPANPVIVFWLIWQGATTVPSTYTDQIQALRPVSITTGVTDITGMNAVAGAVYGTPYCEKGPDSAALLFSVSLLRWNIPGLRAALTLFGTLPDELRGSIILLEAYSTNYVTEMVPNDATAYPDRYNQILVSPNIGYTHNSTNTTLDDIAASYGVMIRSALLEGSGQPLHSYVNHAHGDERLQALYGYQPWRLEKLRELKLRYDPDNKFRYYGPIDVPHRYDSGF